MVLKIKSELKGNHIHSRFFSGPDKTHLVLSGTLIQNIEEWQLVGAALRLGSNSMSGHLEVILEGDEEIVNQLSERRLLKNA